MNTLLKISIIIIFISNILLAQLKMSDAESQVIMLHPTIYSMDSKIKMLEENAKSAKTFNPLSITVNSGQYNSYLMDQSITIRQDFAPIGSLKAHVKLLKLQKGELDAEFLLKKKELQRQFRSLWIRWEYESNMNELFKKQDSLLQKLQNAIEIRKKVGEGDGIESKMINIMKSQLDLQSNDFKIRAEATQKQVQTLIVNTQPLEKRDWKSLLFVTSKGEINSPMSKMIDSRIVQAKSKMTYEKKMMNPSFTLGYYNQSLTGTQTINGVERTFSRAYRFQGLEISMALPWHRKPLKQKLAAISHEINALNSELSALQKDLEIEKMQLESILNSQKMQITTWNEKIIKDYSDLESYILISLQTGNVGFWDVYKILQQSYDSQFQYLTLQYQFLINQTNYQFITE